MPNRPRGLELLGMEFRRFLHLIVLLPAQILRSGRRIIYRIMGYNSWLKDFFAAWENLRRMASTWSSALLTPSHDVVLEHLSCSTRRALPSPARKWRLY